LRHEPAPQPDGRTGVQQPCRPGSPVSELNNDAHEPLTSDLVEWAEIIFVMERSHRTKLAKRFRRQLRANVLCLDIPDEYAFMQPELVTLIETRAGRHLSQ
jgi:predicted protein tyrosine phosphatase